MGRQAGALLPAAPAASTIGGVKAPMEELKSTLMEQLRKLPATALQALTTDLVKIGLDHLPDAIHWLRTLPFLAKGL